MSKNRFQRDGWVQMPEFPIDETKDQPKIEKHDFEDIDPKKLKEYLKEIKKQKSKD